MRRPRFDSTISVGDVLAVITLLAGMWAGFSSIRERLTALETMVGPMWEQFINRDRVSPASAPTSGRRP